MLNRFVSILFKVHEINHYWNWMNNTFIPSLMPPLYYNNITPYESGYLADTPTAWLLGVARLRQLRIRKGTYTHLTQSPFKRTLWVRYFGMIQITISDPRSLGSW